MEKKLIEVCRIQYGYAFDSAKFSDSQGVPLIRIRDVVRGFSETFTTEECGEEYIVNDGDMLIGMDGEFNIAHWKGGKAYLNQRVCRLIPSNEVDALYLYYFMPKALKAIEDKTPFVTVKHLSAKELNKVIVPVPLMDEQKKIANSLKKVDELISLRKEQLAKLDQLVKSRFIELFGDGHDGKAPTKMLGSICKFQQGTQIPVEEQFEEQISGYKRFLRIIDYTQAPQPPRYVNVNGKEVDEKSVVIVRYGATAGFVGRGYQGILANNLFEIMPDETILSKDFLFLALKYGTFEEEVHAKAFGAAMPALSFSMMNDIPVVVPATEQQQQFVSFVKQTDKSKRAIQQSLDKLELLKKSLMQEYFG